MKTNVMTKLAKKNREKKKKRGQNGKDKKRKQTKDKRLIKKNKVKEKRKKDKRTKRETTKRKQTRKQKTLHWFTSTISCTEFLTRLVSPCRRAPGARTRLVPCSLFLLFYHEGRCRLRHPGTKKPMTFAALHSRGDHSFPSVVNKSKDDGGLLFFTPQAMGLREG